MTDEEKLHKYSESNNLSISELRKLRDEIAADPDLKETLKLIDTLEEISSENHFDIEILSQYVLYIKNESEYDKNIISIAPRIEEHMKFCSKCRQHFNLLKAEFEEVNHFLLENITKEKISGENEDNKKSIGQKSFFRYAFSAAASVILIITSLFVVSEISRPEYVKLTSSFHETEVSITRGRNSEYFILAVDQLEKKNYSEAISLLQKDIDNSKNSFTIFYSYYILGIANVQSAYNDYLGLFENYDSGGLKNAEYNFSQSVKLNDSGMFDNVKANSFYFLGQANLLQEDFEDARKYLKLSIEEGSEYADEANKLLNTIN